MFAFQATTEDAELAGGLMSTPCWEKLHLELKSVVGEFVRVELKEIAFTPTFEKHISSLQAALPCCFSQK